MPRPLLGLEYVLKGGNADEEIVDYVDTGDDHVSVVCFAGSGGDWICGEFDWHARSTPGKYDGNWLGDVHA